MRTILVVANETLGGSHLLQRVQEEAAAGPIRVVICVPRQRPHHGALIYDETVFDAAQVRIDFARGVLRELGIDAIGEVGDPEPFSAAMDAIAEHHPDHIIISTFPAASSGWLRRNFVEQIEAAVDVPVEHIVTDPAFEKAPFHTTLVVANRTASGDRLIDELRTPQAEPSDGRRRALIFVVPIEGGEPIAVRRARARLDQVVDRARAAGFVAAGMTGDPDPFTATLNALDLFDVDDIVISTYPETRSGWLRADLVERVRKASRRPVQHVVAERREAPA